MHPVKGVVEIYSTEFTKFRLPQRFLVRGQQLVRLMSPFQLIAHPIEANLLYRFTEIGVQIDEPAELVGTIEHPIAFYL